MVNCTIYISSYKLSFTARCCKTLSKYWNILKPDRIKALLASYKIRGSLLSCNWNVQMLQLLTALLIDEDLQLYWDNVLTNFSTAVPTSSSAQRSWLRACGNIYSHITILSVSQSRKLQWLHRKITLIYDSLCHGVFRWHIGPRVRFFLCGGIIVWETFSWLTFNDWTTVFFVAESKPFGPNNHSTLLHFSSHLRVASYCCNWAWNILRTGKHIEQKWSFSYCVACLNINQHKASVLYFFRKRFHFQWTVRFDIHL